MTLSTARLHLSNDTTNWEPNARTMSLQEILLIQRRLLQKVDAKKQKPFRSLLAQPELWKGDEMWVSCADPCLVWAFLPTTEFCLLQGKHGGFEHEKKVDSVYLDPLAYREFAFLDMPDGGQGTSPQDGPLHILKQGMAHSIVMDR